MRGLVTGVHKTGYDVLVDKKTYFCIVNNSYSASERPAVGDIALIEKEYDQYLLKNIEERKTIIGRYDHDRNRFQVFAANVDVAFIVTSANKEFNINRVKRFLNLISEQDIRPVVVLTKKDLADDLSPFISQIEELEEDVDILPINAMLPEDVMKLLNFVKRGQTMLLLGASGVGKSTITNTLTGLNIRTQETQGEKHGNRGKHTTSARNLYQIPKSNGKKIIDSPGISIIATENDIPQRRR